MQQMSTERHKTEHLLRRQPKQFLIFIVNLNFFKFCVFEVKF